MAKTIGVRKIAAIAHDMNERMANGEYISVSELEAQMMVIAELGNLIGMDIDSFADDTDVFMLRHKDGRMY